MRIFLFVLILASHLAASSGFWRRASRGLMPRTCDFAAISVLLYYDLGIVLELLGFAYESRYFRSLLAVDLDVYLRTVAALIALPWLFHLGAAIASRRETPIPEQPVSRLARSQRIPFYAAAGLITAALAVWGVLLASRGDAIWITRHRIGATLGAAIVIVYLPLHLLAFYVRQQDSRSRGGSLFCFWLAVASVSAALPLGQRTLVLLPFLLVLAFRFGLRRQTVLVGAITLTIAAAALLPVFKWQYAYQDWPLEDLVVNTIYADYSRTPILGRAVELAEPAGTRLLPYPLAGYAYSALFFAPRSWAPFKGFDTTKYFTGYVVGTDVSEITWGFGIGVVEELLINCGWWFLFPGLLLYGIAMGFADNWSSRVPSVIVAFRCAGLWLCGYNLPAILLTFGVMAIATWGADVLFVRSRRAQAVNVWRELAWAPARRG